MVATATRQSSSGSASPVYARLEEKILGRDQVGASEVFYDLLKDGRPLTELVGEITRIHAPYTHVPYHQRLDDGVVRFVNNDHCLLSSGAGLRLMKQLPRELAYLPLAQTLWYLPTGLDPWNQLLGKAPGHYTRLYQISFNEAPPPPQVHWEDQEPLHIEGTFSEKLNHWLTLVQRGEVLQEYRVFQGLLEDAEHRQELLAQLVFAGLIDVQDRMLFNRSYTTGHKSYRARATVELGNAIGWENAHSVVYAGVPDIAVGPRWYSIYEMGCNVVQDLLEGRDAELRQNTGSLSRAEARETVDTILHSYEPVWIEQLVKLLKAGKGMRQILDAIQIAAAEVILYTGPAIGYSMPQHAYEYTNTLRWYYDTFTHQHQLKLLFVAASIVNQASHHQIDTPDNGPMMIRAPRGAGSLSAQQILDKLDESTLALDAEAAVAWTQAYLRGGYERGPLLETLSIDAAKIGNDPHNQEIGLCLVEDYCHSTAPDRERLLLAAAKHNAGHRKYGDPLEAYRRFAGAFGISSTQTARGDAPVEAALLDD